MNRSATYTEVGESELLKRAAGGDTLAFTAFMKRHERAVGSYLIRLLEGDPDQVSDCMQETFLRAWRRVSSYQGKSTPKTWLFGVATNVFREHMRTRGLDPLAHVDTASPDAEDKAVQEESPFPWAETPLEALSREERGDLLARAVQSLPPALRSVFLLSCVEGQKYTEIALILSIPVGTVCSRKAAALAQLRRLLGSLEDQP